MSDYALAACPVCGLVFFKHPGREYPPCHSVSESEMILDLTPTPEVSHAPTPTPAPDLGPHLEAPLPDLADRGATRSSEQGPSDPGSRGPAPRRRRPKSPTPLITGGGAPAHHPPSKGGQP